MKCLKKHLEHLADRDGFVIGGRSYFSVENPEHAKARGANIYASNGTWGNFRWHDMVAPLVKVEMQCDWRLKHFLKVKLQLRNAHGTSTPVGDERR